MINKDSLPETDIDRDLPSYFRKVPTYLWERIFKSLSWKKIEIFAAEDPYFAKIANASVRKRNHDWLQSFTNNPKSIPSHKLLYLFRYFKGIPDYEVSRLLYAIDKVFASAIMQRWYGFLDNPFLKILFVLTAKLPDVQAAYNEAKDLFYTEDADESTPRFVTDLLPSYRDTLKVVEQWDRTPQQLAVILSKCEEDSYINLRGINLSNVYLTGICLKNTNLRNTDLCRTNLQEANLQGANLFQAELREANLQRANMYRVYMLFANLRWIELAEANLQNAFLQNAEMYRANLRGVNLQGADMYRADLRETRLEKANLQEANLQKAKMHSARMLWADLRRANLQKANLVAADLRGIKLQRAKLQKANMQKAKLMAGDLRGAKLQEANLQKAKLAKADLQWANLTLADLRGMKLEDTKLSRIKAAGILTDDDVLAELISAGADLEIKTLEDAQKLKCDAYFYLDRKTPREIRRYIRSTYETIKTPHKYIYKVNGAK